MTEFLRLVSLLSYSKWNTGFAVFFHFLAAVMTILSIPLVIPFFQILFEVSPSSFNPPDNPMDLEAVLNYGFSRLIAMSDRSTALTFICITVIIVFALRNLFRYLASYFLVPAQNAIIKKLRSELFAAFTNQTLTDRLNSKRGQLLSLMSHDLEEINHGILVSIEMIFKTPLIVLGSLLFMIWINAEMSIIAIVLILFTLLIIGRLSRFLKNQSLKLQNDLGEIVTLSDELISAPKIIKAFGAETHFRSKFDFKNNVLFRLSNKLLRRRDLASPLSEFLGFGIVVVLLFYGSHEVLAEQLEPSTFFAFIFAFYNIIDPAKSFSREYFNIQKASGAYHRIQDFINSVHQPLGDQEDLRPANFKESIEFRQVGLRMTEHKEDILRDVSFTLKKGQRLAIVGPSGAGKTSLIDLLLGFFNPSSGNILIDGYEIGQYNLSSYRSLFGLVTQDPHLFHTSIRDNITLNTNQTTEEKFLTVCKQAMVDKICQSKSLTYDAIIGDDGSKLSGGEKQRIALARALYREPQILILDEPTSALDNESEVYIKQAIQNSLKNQTTILITHNLEFLTSTDMIMFLEHGRIVEMGSFEDLTSSKGRLYSLLNSNKTKS